MIVNKPLKKVPGCPNCHSKQARPHCMPSVQDKTNGPKKSTGAQCPWLECRSCGHNYDPFTGRHYDPKAVIE